MTDADRQLGAFTLVVAGACAAIALFLIAPIKASNESARDALASAQSAARQLGQLQPNAPKWELAAQNNARIERWYDQQSEPALDPARIHTLLNRTGRSAGITIARIDPSGSGNADETEESAVQSVGFSIEATGSLEQLADFARALREGNAFTRIDSFSLTPIQSSADRELRAIIKTTHFAFRVPEQSTDETPLAEVGP